MVTNEWIEWRIKRFSEDEDYAHSQGYVEVEAESARWQAALRELLARRAADEGAAVVPIVAVDFDPMRDVPEDTTVRPLTGIIIDEIPGLSYGAGDTIQIRRRSDRAKGGGENE